MPYREKVAWLSILAIALVFMGYFTWARLHPPTSAIPNLAQMALYAAAAGVWVLLLGLGHLVLRRLAPLEARLKPDERDLAIEYRSRKHAYFVLLSGMILVGCVMPFIAGGWEIVNSAIFIIVLAEVVHYGTVVYSYRRQQ